MENFRLDVYETREERTFSANVLNLKDYLELILGTVNTNGKAITAACFNGDNEEPIAVVYKTPDGKVRYYYPD